MVFHGSKKVLFDTAYHAYRDIIKQTESVYAEIKDYIEDLDEELRQLPIIALSVDIYLQVNLYKIAIADNRISDDEKYFIRTVIDNLELLKKIPKYKTFVTKLDESSYEKIKDAYRISIPHTSHATELILKAPHLFVDYEITKGKMDDVFLSVTGKRLVGGEDK